MNTTPVVTVVVAAYNAEQWIVETLDSVATQTFKDYEVIVVDDGSTDRTATVARAHKIVTKCIEKPHSGQPSSRNVGITAASGDYIAFVDADDLWLPRKLELQLELLNVEKDLLWCYTDAYYFDGKSLKIINVCAKQNRLFSGNVLRPLVLNCFIPSPTVVVRRDTLLNVGLFDEASGNANEDWNMWLRLAALHNIGLVNSPLACVRVHEESMTRKGSLELELNNALFLVRRTVCHHPLALAPFLPQALANVKARMAWKAVARGRRKLAFALIFDILITAPKHAPRLFYMFLMALLPMTILRTFRRCRRYMIMRRYAALSVDSLLSPSSSLHIRSSDFGGSL